MLTIILVTIGTVSEPWVPVILQMFYHSCVVCVHLSLLPLLTHSLTVSSPSFLLTLSLPPLLSIFLTSQPLPPDSTAVLNQRLADSQSSVFGAMPCSLRKLRLS